MSLVFDSMSLVAVHCHLNIARDARWCERGKDECKGCHLKRKTQNMPNKYKDSNDASRRRLRKKQRVAHQHRRQAKNRSNRGKGLLAGSELILRNTGRRTFKKR
eukprot:TRINITY_DN6164_c0_g1_i1.p3 TRINITY_DN6164_c0_g1~~TRINITY_DN6164_c0_g1_i1.p3  ORF type:complete len:104 (+),score=14.86 TRINITY_DN6164_c0_g1_i1:914-1225(+)